jgi:tetratricopeptide (TPR) repeat protein
LRRSQNDLALADLDGVLAADPRNAEALVNRGAALVQLRRFGEAISALTDALSYGVSEPYKAYYNRGAAREALGDLQGAYDDYSTALQIQPDWGPANAEVARFVRGRREHLADVLNHPATP